jgi:uncharacterized protein (DUF2236 family)
VSPIVLPDFVQRRVDELAAVLMRSPDPFDFTRPAGEEALVPADSVSWRIFKNPLSVFVGGVAAVILELAEPRVRTGVWEHSSFRSDPVGRLQRTGRAAMITVYGPRSAAEAMIARVVRLHEKVSGIAPNGEAYGANDPELLTWVQATASFGFTESHHRYVRTLSGEERQRLYAEAMPSARLYGATGAPASDDERAALFAAMRPRLEPSAILDEFFSILRAAPAFPGPLRSMQRMLIRAAVDLVPAELRTQLEIDDYGLRPGEAALVQTACGLADRIVLNVSPAVQSCRRLGLPADYLYRAR